MSGFIDVIDNLITTLQNDAALASFCQTEWGKTLSVIKAYRQRQEINLSELPLILITRPAVIKQFRIGARDGAHTVRLYAGFHQPDKLKALNEFVEFEEKLDDALLSADPNILGAISISPTASQNDEGEFHPVYFTVMDIEINHRR